MDAFMPLVLLALCASVRSEPLPDAIRHRSRSAAGVYASEYAREYEPLTYAAIPLHAPIPVRYLQVLPYPQDQQRREPARQPAPQRPVYAASAQRPVYAASAQQSVYSLPPQQLFDGYSPPYRYAQPYANSVNYVVYDEDAEETNAPTILYARPNPTGGYTYRRKPTKKRNTPSKKRPTEEPILIRVHKYRIIRDR